MAATQNLLSGGCLEIIEYDENHLATLAKDPGVAL